MHGRTTAERGTLYEDITQAIVAAIERGPGRFRMPWHHDGVGVTRPTNLASQRPYRGVNVLALWASAMKHGYPTGLWGTYRQWAEKGGQVRKGERATTVVFWRQSGTREQDGSDENGEDGRHDGDRHLRLFARAYSAFNLAQVDGYEVPAVEGLSEADRIAHADAFIAATGVPITEGGTEAFYRIDLDRIFLPPFAAFKDAASHIGVTAHELGHATGHKSRLDRDLTGRFGSAKAGMEELVAELTAAFVLADLGIAHQPRPDHAAYIASWLKVLDDDPKAIFTAASKAQAAADWMHAQQPQATKAAS
jgi:antirestriction protein ArdC